ncbi:dioxygenase [Litoreibacter janthinus]|uniref:Hydroxyquinol 1,2-dioxygenase n=1 Tax=Litoreibacter janthinus TaxID=670154 RepID=A0A1I6HCH8_9RHOB|nr:dioxygenase [Litoreibacter janthinus]SFR52153.1 hydroxyquinol 1,2-dioxygenase [Litoreibacter janthinus]
MRTVTKENITDVFAAYFGEDTDPRTREVLVAMARHLHDFAREVNLTHAEWRKGLSMLEHAGRITSPERNEFVLFSDVLGLSSLVDMMHSNPRATSSSVLGPFHVSNPPKLEIGGDMKRDFEGPVLCVEGQVRDLDGNPIPHAEIDIWQTAPNGLYSSQDPDQDIHSFHGLMTADDSGHFRFTTVRPVEYTVPSDGPVGELLDAAGRHPWRPSHLHYIIKAPGFISLVTEVFPDDDPYLDQDTVFGVRDDLVMSYVEKPASEFPDGMALSAQITDPFLYVKFDVILAPE